MRVLGVLAAALLAAGNAAAQSALPYRNPRLPVDTRVRDLLRRMTLEEKFWQLYMIPGDLSDTATHDYSHGIFGLQVPAPADTAGGAARAHATRINAIQRWFVGHTRLGIPIIPFDEAVHGLVRAGATTFPSAIALAATWDTSLMDSVAGAIAEETRSRGVRDVLSPVINVASDVRWGRVEETYGEDPFLVSRMGDAFVRAFERRGVVTTPKHFVANVGEGGRDSYPIEVSDRMLAEEFFPPFESALRAGARSIMTAYNSVDGVPATQNHHLLTDILRKQWGFRGFVISDAAATGGATVLHMTEASTPLAAEHAWEAGLDVVFQSSWEQHRFYWEAVRTGMIAPRIIDSAVAHVLRAKFQLGLFEHPYVDSDSAALASAAHAELARGAAAASAVLLKNNGVLPIDTTRVHRIAVIGRDAAEARLGGYSADAHPVSLLDALRTVPGLTVTYVTGPPRMDTEAVVIPEDALRSDSGEGLHGEYFNNITLGGTPTAQRLDHQVDFRWTFNGPARGLANNWYSVRWTGRVTVPANGAHIGIEGSDGWRLWVDGRLLEDDWVKRSYGLWLSQQRLDAGLHDVRLEYFETTGNARVRLMWDIGISQHPYSQLESAMDSVHSADLVIVAAGVEEGEFRDRARLGLPGSQSGFIEGVAATGHRGPVVVVLYGGSAITMPWLDKVDAVVDAWYPGQAGGTGIVDILRGRVNPAGRLPITFPIAEGQLPLRYNHKPTGRGDDYVDLTGQPLFPFGFGLSYTTFDYRNLRITPDTMSAGDSARVSCTIVNTGRVAGDEVVQLYLRDEIASVARPVEDLKGFRRIHLAPGDSVDVAFVLGREALKMLDKDRHWIVEPGDFRIMIGASSRDIRLRGELTVSEGRGLRARARQTRP